jgi:hypothetical protein
MAIGGAAAAGSAVSCSPDSVAACKQRHAVAQGFRSFVQIFCSAAPTPALTGIAYLDFAGPTPPTSRTKS